MKTVLIFIGVAVFAIVGALWFRSTAIPTYQISVAAIPQVLTELSAAHATPAFAILMIPQTPGPGSDEKLEVELSIEAGKPGFDWIPPSPQNPEDEARFTEFARAAGYTAVAKEAHGVRYLRVENGDLAHLCGDVIVNYYHHAETDPVELLVQGFAWKP